MVLLNRLIIASFPIAYALVNPSLLAQALSYTQLSGCYELTVSEWNRPLGGDEGFHTIPTSIRLDTVPALQGGRVVAPDISYPMGRSMRGLPRWEILGDTVRIVWSNGFSPTIIRLTEKGQDLSGWAEATSDAIPAGKPNWPRAKVVARRMECVK
jgi:hypothetical protein